MRHALFLPATVALAGLTAVTLFGAALMLPQPVPAAPGALTDAASRSTAIRFYDAVNAVIGTGDLSLIEAVVAPEFVDHDGVPGLGADRAGLIRYLQSLHATAPSASLVVDAIAADEDRVLARVTVHGADERTFNGLVLPDGPPVWGPLDVLRVADGRIVERWTTSDGTSVLEPLGKVALGTSLPTDQVVLLERLTVPPESRLTVPPADELRVVAVEAGTLAVAIDPAASSPALISSAWEKPRPAPVPPGTSVELSSGALLALPPLTGFTLRNDGEEAVQVLLAVTFPAGSPERDATRADPAYPNAQPWRADSSPAAGTPADVASRPVAGGRRISLSPGAMTVAHGRLILAPGAVLPLARAGGPVLLVVEAGTPELETGSGAAWVTREASGASSDRDEAALVAGDGALVPPGTDARLRNTADQPVVVLVVTMLPDIGGA